MNDIKVPPFTEAQKMVIEATEKLAGKCDKINANINKWGRKNICDVDGIDEVEMTNEEWLCSLSTEEKARWIVKIVDCEFCPVKKPCKKQPCKKQIEKWLKEIHQ